MLICEARIKVPLDGRVEWMNRNVEYKTARMEYKDFDRELLSSRHEKDLFIGMVTRDIGTLITQTGWKWITFKIHVFDEEYDLVLSQTLHNKMIVN